MRVTQSMLYGDMVTNMNSLLSDYFYLSEQASSQKKINRPSDSPVGTIQVLNYRASIANTQQYTDNSKDAASWLASSDSALKQAEVVMQRLSELAEQASTGTVSEENRLQIAFEARELYATLVNIANTEYADQHLFSGHKTETSAYNETLGITTYSPGFEDVDFTVTGSLDRTAMVRFPQDGEIGGATPLDYEYSLDGGDTWLTGTVPANSTTITVGTAVIDLAANNASTPPTTTANVTAYNPDEQASPSNGTMLYVRPAAMYNGDDSDPPPDVDVYGTSNISRATAEGLFTNNVQVKILEDANVSIDGEVAYSYSTDNGITWENATVDSVKGSTGVRLIVPNGHLDVEVGGDGSLNAGQQFVIRPDRAEDIGYEIAEDEFLDVTSAGKDIFGGLYQGKNDTYASAVDGINIFEEIGEFISALETNNMDEVGNSLEAFRDGNSHLLTEWAKIGGKENRVSLNVTILEGRLYDEQNRMSSIEDIDMTQLATDLSRQYTAYQTVLQSSSMIMNLSLMNYL